VKKKLEQKFGSQVMKVMDKGEAALKERERLLAVGTPSASRSRSVV
jgi:hypothetical protein